MHNKTDAVSGKIKFIADTASDIPDQFLAQYAIDMPSVPIAVDGREYFERKSFSIPEFYDILSSAREIPATSRVPAADYAALYHKAWTEGYTDIISVTINAGGSGTYDSSCMGIKMFFDEYPQAKDAIKIHVVDSKTYSMGYGYPVIEAAKMAEQGKTVPEILAYLADFFNRLEIYLVCFTLDYARKSGRISAASAFVGDVLGVRPVILMADGQTKTIDKLRGSKLVNQKLCEIYQDRRTAPDDPAYIISAQGSYGKELAAHFKSTLGMDVTEYKAGASIVINAGPNIVAICLLGPPRA